MLKGSCYCKAITYEIRGKVLMFFNCHCPDCRKITSSTFSSMLVTDSDGFHVVGEENLVPFQSSLGKKRYFCKTCGSHLFSETERRPGVVYVKAGSLDDDPPLKPQAHVWTKFKAPWHDITDSLPQFPEGLPQNWKARQPDNRTTAEST